MKIAFFVHSFPLVSETFILNQITGLIDRGHDVDIYALRPRPVDFQVVHADVERYHLMERTQYFSDMPRNYFLRVLKAFALIIKHRAWLQPKPLLLALNIRKYGREAMSLRILYATTLLVGKEHDAVHCQFGNLGPEVLRLKQIGAISGKLVTSFRGNDLTGHLQTKRICYRQLFSEGDLFFPVCEGFRQRLINNGCSPTKITVHCSGVDLAKLQYSVRRRAEGEPTELVSIGRFVEKKGFTYAVKAIARIVDSGYKVSYSLIGDGELRPDLEHLIDQLGVGDHVRLLGCMPQSEVMLHLRNSHLLLAPSVTGTDGNQEGIPNVLKEAMAMGMPVISTLHSGIPELVENGKSGFLVPERDVEALADRVAYLMDHPERWPEMGAHGRKCIEKYYDINRLNDTLLEHYDYLLG